MAIGGCLWLQGDPKDNRGMSTPNCNVARNDRGDIYDDRGMSART
jgi:hypothetical protein